MRFKTLPARFPFIVASMFTSMLALMFASGGARAESPPPPVANLQVPAGFHVNIFAEGVEDARSLALGAKGTVFVSSKSAGNVYALVDRNHDGKADETVVIARNLNMPNGIAFLDGTLYVAELERVLRFDHIEQNLASAPKPQVVYADLPKETHHGWRYLRAGADKQLYMSIGAPCNVCLRPEPIFASLTRMPPQGGKPVVIASGIRNSVGFDWHPTTGELWFTENGRDWLGDDQPGDELNRLAQVGQNFGFPYCHAGNIADPEFGNARSPCRNFVPPVQTLGPHVAALGMRFYRGSQFPEHYRGQIFIAEHGSWNRKEKIGYRVTLVRLKGNQALSYETFASGWLKDDGTVLGRPVDVLQLTDGSLLVSDDLGGRIYRISYKG